jgi:dolichol-phosphate mannosyltransferase
LARSISVVLPAYNESESIGATIERILRVSQANPRIGEQLELVVVIDGSTDGTAALAAQHIDGRLNGMVIELAKNVGSHAAIRCGLEAADGDIVVVLAADGQDPPEMLPDMIAAFDSGADVVWGRRRSRDHDPLPTRMLAAGYYRLFRILTGYDYPSSGIDVMAVSRRVADLLHGFGERNASVFLIVFNMGFRQAVVEYERGERLAGESGWSLRKRIRLAVDMLTSFSAAPIRLLSLIGATVGAAGVLFGLITLVRGLLGRIPVSGWASLMVISSLMSGVTLLAIGFLGEYVWRTLDEVRARPLYIEAKRQTYKIQGAISSEV